MKRRLFIHLAGIASAGALLSGAASNDTAVPSDTARDALQKTLKAKDVAAAVKKVKAGKLGAGTVNPVAAKAAKPYAVYASVLLMAMNQGMLSGSGVSKVMVVKQPVLQK